MEDQEDDNDDDDEEEDKNYNLSGLFSTTQYRLSSKDFSSLFDIFICSE